MKILQLELVFPTHYPIEIKHFCSVDRFRILFSKNTTSSAAMSEAEDEYFSPLLVWRVSMVGSC